MSNIEKIKAEIERMHQEAVLAACGNDTDWLRSRIGTCVDILAFIDSLPEDHFRDSTKMISEDLEEEIQGMYQAIFGTDIINRREMVYLETFDMIARHFAEWGAKHLK